MGVHMLDCSVLAGSGPCRYSVPETEAAHAASIDASFVHIPTMLPPRLASITPTQMLC